MTEVERLKNLAREWYARRKDRADQMRGLLEGNGYVLANDDWYEEQYICSGEKIRIFEMVYMKIIGENEVLIYTTINREVSSIIKVEQGLLRKKGSDRIKICIRAKRGQRGLFQKAGINRTEDWDGVMERMLLALATAELEAEAL